MELCYITDSLGCTATDSVYVNLTPCISGCIDSLANNYNPLANIDDGSCNYCTNDTSYTNITACDSLVWNDSTYIQSGTYSYNDVSNNSSMSFDGNDYVFFANNSSLNFAQADFTIHAWINPNNITQNARIIAKGETSSAGCYQMNIANDKLRISFHNTDFFSNSNVIQSNTWQLITVKRTAGIVKGYVDGVEVISGSNYLNLSSSQILAIGYEPGYSSYFDGYIDNVSIWNYAFDDNEIYNYINSCSPTGNETGLVGYWNFEEGSGNTVFDQTSNGNNGIINGATYDTNVPTQSCN